MAVLSPYFPYPLAHGGAVRIFHLLREMAREFDVELFAFTDAGRSPELAPVAGILRARGAGGEAALSRAALVHAAAARSPRIPLARHAPRARRRAPRVRLRQRCKWSTRSLPHTAATSWWSTTSPSTSSPRSRAASARSPPGGIGSAGAASKRAPSRRYRRVVVMSKKDAELLGPRRALHGDREWRRPGPLPPGAGAARPAAALHRIVPPLSERDGLSLLHRAASGRCCATSSRR